MVMRQIPRDWEVLNLVPGESAVGAAYPALPFGLQITSRPDGRIWNAVVTRLGLRGGAVMRKPKLPDASVLEKLRSFKAEAVYSVACTPELVSLVAQLAAELRLPVLQYFLDYQGFDRIGTSRCLRQLAELGDVIWALTDAIADDVARRCGRRPEVVAGFCNEEGITASDKTVWGAPPRGVLAGNFWDIRLADFLRCVWAHCRELRQELFPLDWLADPSSVLQISKVGITVEPEIVPAGHYSGEEYIRRLAQYDFAVVPFNVGGAADNDYARYSLPSRVTEMLTAGLPLFCLCSPDTPLAEYVRRHEVGVSVAGSNPEATARQLIRFAFDTESLRRLSQNAVRLARRNFRGEIMQGRLSKALLGMVQKPGAAN
jgi:hypothetical protein